MGKIREIPPVKYFTGIITSKRSFIEEVVEILSKKYGSIDYISDIVDFDFTDYYEKEMGSELYRCFITFKDLLVPEILPDVKIFTNSIEEKFSTYKDKELIRNINLDPGYLEMAKVVLATTKNHRHRVYLRDGIYGEVTLYWSKGSFHHFSHTYPDYRTNFYINFFNKRMEVYRKQLNILFSKLT